MRMLMDKDMKEYLEECYNETCISLEKNQLLLKEVEAGTMKLDPPEGIDYVKSTIETLTKTKELLESQLGKDEIPNA